MQISLVAQTGEMDSDAILGVSDVEAKLEAGGSGGGGGGGGEGGEGGEGGNGGEGGEVDMLRLVTGKPGLVLPRDTVMGEAVLLLTVHRTPILFATDRGRLVGVVDVNHLAQREEY